MTSKQRIRSGRAALALPLTMALFLAACGSDSNSDSSPEPPRATSPNILFIVLDDLGVDQLSVFGYGGLTPSPTPGLEAIARQGVRFSNAWSMPTCSPTRATFFEGRYPFRTQVFNAILANDLANSQVSPYEVTTPKLLKQKGYVSALIGKMHLSGSDLNPANNPLGHEVMRELGWDYFAGYLDGAPYPIDTTAGGVAPPGTYSCGFVPSAAADPLHGADSGACYLPDGSCSVLTAAEVGTPGRACLERGGILDPNAACQASPPFHIDFATQNAYYTGEWVINHPDGSNDFIPPSDPRARGYRTVLETDRAIEWIKQQPADRPWMLSLGYSAIHTPLQPPPDALLSAPSAATDGFNCLDVVDQRRIADQMIEALDREIGRLLVETGLARRGADGSLEFRLEEANTVLIVVGDNGTYAPTVKAPFDAVRSKGSPYQTGVWVPLLVAGPVVNEPGREVPHMVNAVDLFSLFGELAGVDVRAAVPANRQLDAQPMLSYLTEPGRPAIRTTNYTEMGTNISAADAEPTPPCVIPMVNTCVQVFPQKELCEDQSGVWYGPGGAAGTEGLPSCCAVNDYLVARGEEPVNILPRSQRAIRDEFYKLVRLERDSCAGGGSEIVDELYRIDQAAPLPQLDRAHANLLALPHLTPEAQQHYDALRQALVELVSSEVACPGDGNGDGVVDEQDLENWAYFSTLNGGGSSWYDFNHDGRTDQADRDVILSRLGSTCAASPH